MGKKSKSKKKGGRKKPSGGGGAATTQAVNNDNTYNARINRCLFRRSRDGRWQHVYRGIDMNEYNNYMNGETTEPPTPSSSSNNHNNNNNILPHSISLETNLGVHVISSTNYPPDKRRDGQIVTSAV